MLLLKGLRVYGCNRKFTIGACCIRKIPLNPPLQKGEAVGLPGRIGKSLTRINRNWGIEELRIEEFKI